MLKEKSLKRISVLLLLLFVNQIFFPSVAFAVTGGPGQPELESFTPFNSSDMVDPFSGDFKYNIPLLNVPGPNGGYPINIGYSGNLGTEQESGWVGLGWSLNPGAINRQLRGLPDDFDGTQKVERERKMKPNRTFTLGVGTAFSELFGFDLSKKSKRINFGLNANLNLTVNNYSGFSLGLGIGMNSGFALIENKAVEPSDGLIEIGMEEEEPVDDGVIESIKLSYAFRARQWLKYAKVPFRKDKMVGQFKSSLERGLINSLTNLPSSAFFAGSGSSLLEIDFPRTSNSFTFDGKLGADRVGLTSDLEFTLFYSQQNYSESSIDYPAYGYMHTEAGAKDEEAMMDFYSDKKSSLGASSAFLPVPVLTNDVFSVTGQGVSGAYRAQLGTIPMLSTPEVESATNSYGFGLDLGASESAIKAGFNPKASFTKSNSGRWTSGDAAIGWFTEDLGLSASESTTFEQNAFIKLGDLTDNQWNSNSILKNANALRFNLKNEFHGLSWKPKVVSQLYPRTGSSFTVSKADRIRKERPARSNLFKYFTTAQLEDIIGDTETHRQIGLSTTALTTDGDEIVVTSEISQELPDGDQDASLIHQIEVENNGVDYVYGIPVFTHYKVDKTFSIAPPEDFGDIRGNVNVETKEHSNQNESGRGALYNANTVDGFAHAYLLTEIYSNDYVDITDNGPTEDDFGSYTKFDYLKLYDDFVSRSPAHTSSQTVGSYVAGVNNDEDDDMATYSESKKDIYYLRKVETKTHYAEFQLAVRGDDFARKPGTTTDQKLAKLQKITLYKKNGTDPATEIKSVEFEYNDDESSAGLMQGAQGTTNGKLTLKRIRFTFEGQKTDTYLNPFEFDYYNTGVDFSEGDSDRWGKYQPDEYNDFNNNYLYPYVAQNRDLDDDGSVDSDDSDLRDTWASAWRLKTIGLPTGGEVEIKYESDDYGYVQNKKAQDMYQIMGIGEVGEYSLSSNRIYIKLKEHVASGSASLALKEQLEADMEHVYFKALVVLKDKPAQYNVHGPLLQDGDVKEFIDGYLEFSSLGFDESCETSEGGVYQYAYVDVANGSGGENAIRLAAANYLRLNGELLNSSIDINFSGTQTPSELIDIASSIIKSATSNKEMNRNFIETVLGPSKSYCSDLGTNFPSIVRLNAQNQHKYGGGSRVSEILVKDNWNIMEGTESTFNMKQVFSYQTEEGFTSGVAEYEPLTGGEENPLRQPHYYSSERAFLKDEGLLFELPATEALYPSPRVGYSRVVVENIPVNTNGSAISDYSLSSNGIVVNEFYTAKEYPVNSSATAPKKVNMSTLTEVSKWIGGKNFFQPGFSQGYYTELNDMHGKPKSVSTYSSTLGTDEAPFQSTTYYYKTMNGFTEGASNRLDNSVEVLTNDGAVETKTIGQVSDGWAEMAESKTITQGGEIKTNLDMLFMGSMLPIPIPTAIPSVDYSFRLRRTLVLNKLVSKTGIIEKVVTQQEGRTTIVNNLLFDYENGQPLLTQVLNDHDKPIYSYNRPEHWVNSNFKHPWRNWWATVTNTQWKGIIQNGDLILATGGTKYWVEDAENGVLKDESGTSLTISAGSFEGTIIQSGYTGRSGAMSSQIVSLTDPSALGNREFDLFTSYSDKANWLTDIQNDLNEGSLSSATQYYNCDENPLEDCSSPSATFCPTIETESNALRFRDPTKSVTDYASLVFPTEYEDEMGDFTLEKLGNQVRATNGSVVLILNWDDPHNLFPECMPGVLEAGVTLYGHDVKNYEVLENGNYSLVQADIDNNPTRYKDWHDYKTVQSLKNVNQRGYTDDNSTDGYFGTHLDEDGAYDLFIDYNFGAVPDNNTAWVNQGKIVEYDPFGNTLEIENAIGISSSEMFNEDHTLVTATAVNAIYKEIGYQNFENLSGTWSDVHGHIGFVNTAYPTINTSSAHTGNHSLNVTSSTELKLEELEDDKQYRLSFWQQTGTSVLTIGSNCTLDAENIDGWDLITYTFSSTSSGTAAISFIATGVIDDLRFYPSDAAIKTFVYDLNTYRLIAQLDANNFATLYGYNEEGTLSQVKKETNRGIQTISNNVVHRQK